MVPVAFDFLKATETLMELSLPALLIRALEFIESLGYIG